MNAALAQVANPILPVAFARRRKQLHGPSLQPDKTSQPLARRQTGSLLRLATIFSCEVHINQDTRHGDDVQPRDYFFGPDPLIIG